MRAREGVTIVELLIAMTVLGTVLALAFGTITTGVRNQRFNEANVASQAKLRRVLEVISQDIRGSIFGSISDTPYANTATSISFSLITGGTGYQALQQGSSSTVIPGPLALVSNTTPNLSGQTLLLNGEGNGRIFSIAGVAPSAGGNWQITMPACNPVAYTPNTLLYRISTMGYRHDPAARTLLFRTATAAEQPLAFDINAFTISYLYVNQTTNVVTEESAPYRINNVPQKSYVVTVGGAPQTVVLRQIKLYLSTTQSVLGRNVTRSYQTTVDLGYSQALNVKEILPCS